MTLPKCVASFSLRANQKWLEFFGSSKPRLRTKLVSNSDFERSNNGTEYTSEKFNQFCEDSGIEHQLIAPYTPQQNGVCERRNRYILEMTRCMLYEKNLPKEYWEEAASTTVFLHNRLPTKALNNKTPFDVWYGYKPSLKFLKIFGCLCFTHVPQSKRDKLDKRALPGIFIGYCTVRKPIKSFSHKLEK
uniref:Retrovirus-related Pol polyprotein from transposon TNT 1-94 n=1 Tax=Cajanus cajan TaxID=3821 RepID=A0A151TZG1_CAJCA|nr:Retrovirus-related Pol polyprotein from transposon TNT 1-94 [Cajanus cajan]